MQTANVYEVVNTLWPIALSIGGLIVVLARMHTKITVLEEKVKSLFDLWNTPK